MQPVVTISVINLCLVSGSLGAFGGLGGLYWTLCGPGGPNGVDQRRMEVFKFYFIIFFTQQLNSSINVNKLKLLIMPEK